MKSGERRFTYFTCQECSDAMSYKKAYIYIFKKHRNIEIENGKELVLQIGLYLQYFSVFPLKT